MNSRRRVLTFSCAASMIIRRARSAHSTNQDVLEELSCTSASSAVDVTLQSFFEDETRLFQDCRVEIAAVVDDNDDRSARRQEARCVSEGCCDSVNVPVKCAPTYAPFSRANF